MGSISFPLTERIRSDIAVHGLHFAVASHWKRWGKNDPVSFRILMRSAAIC